MFRRLLFRILAAALANGDTARDFLRQQLINLADAAKRTATEIDDVAVALIQRIVNNDVAWEAIWEAVRRLIAADAYEADVRADLQLTAAAKVAADELKIDPITIINLVVMFITWWREWRDRAETEPITENLN